MALSLAAAMLACCAGALVANALGLTGSSLGFAALCASGMASLAGMWTGKQSPATSLFSGERSRHARNVTIRHSGTGLPVALQSQGRLWHAQTEALALCSLRPLKAVCAVLSEARHAGAEVLGGALMLLFFVTIGAAAGSPKSILGCGWLAGFMIVQLAVHLVVVLGVGKLAGLPMQVSHAPCLNPLQGKYIKA